MNNKNLMYAFGSDVVIGVATLTGGGNSADLTLPANSDVPKLTNMASSGARTGEGTYDVVLREGCVPAQVLAVIPVVSPSAGHSAEVTTDYVAATRTIAVTTRNSGGTADDLPTTDKLKLIIIGRDSLAQ